MPRAAKGGKRAQKAAVLVRGHARRVYTTVRDVARVAYERSNEMSATASQASPESVRTFVQEYFDAWKGTDESKILAYYAENVVIHLPTGILKGKSAVRDGFVHPFVTGFPGNVHSVRNLVFGGNLVAVEWSFEAVHSGAFAGIPASGKDVQVPGCSFYEYDLVERIIPAGRIYFDLGTLMRQIGA